MCRSGVKKVTGRVYVEQVMGAGVCVGQVRNG